MKNTNKYFPMSAADKLGLVVVGVSIAIIMLIFLGCGMLGWYKSGVQAEVYRREGIEMTTWEVFVGARPAERKINLNDLSR